MNEDSLYAYLRSLSAGDVEGIVDSFQAIAKQQLQQHGLPCTLVELQRVEETKSRVEVVWSRIRNDPSVDEEVQLAAELFIRCPRVRTYLLDGDAENATWQLNRVWILAANIMLLIDAPALRAGQKSFQGGRRGNRTVTKEKEFRKELVIQEWQKQKELNPRLKRGATYEVVAEQVRLQYPKLFNEAPSSKTVSRYIRYSAK